MPRGWEGNRRSGVALAMRHGLKWFIHLRAQRPRVGDEHPAYAPAGAWLPLPFTLMAAASYGGLSPTVLLYYQLLIDCLPGVVQLIFCSFFSCFSFSKHWK